MIEDGVFEGKDLEEALAAAATARGVPEADLRYEMLEQGRRGLLGLGVRHVRIRVQPTAEDEQQPAPRPHRTKPPVRAAPAAPDVRETTVTPEVVRETIRNWPGMDGEGWPSWAFSNHDAPRFASRWWANGQRDACVRVALMLLMCLRGNVILYQGEELGLPQAHVPFEHLQDPEAIANWPQTLGRDGARTPSQASPATRTAPPIAS